MTAVEKLKNLVNPMKWVQGFMLTKFAKRVAQFGAGALIAILTSGKIADFLTKFGISADIDKELLAESIAVLLTGLIGGLFNTAKHGPLKTVDDEPTAPPAPAK